MLDILHSISHYHWESYHSGNTLNLNSTIIAQNWIPSVFFHESTCKPLFWVNTPWYRRLFIDLPLVPTAVEHVIAIFASCLLRPPCLPESARKVVRATTVLCSEGLLGILGTLWPVESPPGWEQQWGKPSLKQERHQGWSARGEQSWMMWQLWRLWRGRNRSHHPWLPRWPLAPLWISLSSPVFWSTARIFWNHQPEKSRPVQGIPQSIAFSQNMKPTLDDSDGQGVVRWFLLFGAIFIFFVETDSLGLGQSSIEFLAIVRMIQGVPKKWCIAISLHSEENRSLHRSVANPGPFFW